MDGDWGEAIRSVGEGVGVVALMIVFLMVIPVISLMVASVATANLKEEWQ